MEADQAFDQYYEMGVKPICGDYLHEIAVVKSQMDTDENADADVPDKSKKPTSGNEEEKKK